MVSSWQRFLLGAEGDHGIDAGGAASGQPAGEYGDRAGQTQCGEHGGDPSSVEFCHRVGLNYVSCSPFRVPIARLAAAQAALKAAK